jgi:hypothetical protein
MGPLKIFGPGVHVPVGHLRVLARCGEEAPGDHRELVEERAGRECAAAGNCEFPMSQITTWSTGTTKTIKSFKDLLYAMCDRSNAENIVAEMLTYLETADYSIREEMVLKVAILAEKYASDYTWYVDVILKLIRIAGDYVSDEVWFRVIQVRLSPFY